MNRVASGCPKYKGVLACPVCSEPPAAKAARDLADLIQLVNIVALFVFAFSEWPVLRELSALKEKLQAPFPPEAFKR